jgi:hypothetical protein
MKKTAAVFRLPQNTSVSAGLSQNLRKSTFYEVWRCPGCGRLLRVRWGLPVRAAFLGTVGAPGFTPVEPTGRYFRKSPSPTHVLGEVFQPDPPPWPAPARRCAPASHPYRCSGPRTRARRAPEPVSGSCCPASPARSSATACPRVTTRRQAPARQPLGHRRKEPGHEAYRPATAMATYPQACRYSGRAHPRPASFLRIQRRRFGAKPTDDRQAPRSLAGSDNSPLYSSGR